MMDEELRKMLLNFVGRQIMILPRRSNTVDNLVRSYDGVMGRRWARRNRRHR